MNFPKYASKQQRGIIWSLCLTLWRKTVFVNIYPILLIWSKIVVKQIQIFLRIFPFQTWYKKKIAEYFIAVFEIATFLTKKRSSLWIPTKCFKTKERHSLAVCGSLYGEKLFLLIIIPFYWFVQKQWFK